MNLFWQRSYLLAQKTWDKYVDDDGFTLSASLSFYAILSLIPFAMIGISVLGHYLGQSDHLFKFIMEWVQETMPKFGPESYKMLKELIARKLIRGYTGFVFLFLVASLLFASLERILGRIFHGDRLRGFWHARIMAIGLTLFASVLLFVPPLVGLGFNLAQKHGLKVPFSLHLDGTWVFVLSHAIFFYMALWLIPRVRIRALYLFWGAGLFSVATLLARELFRLYVAYSFDRFNLIYGSLSLLVLLVIWIYYLSIAFVWVAEWVSVWQDEWVKSKLA